MSNKTAIQWTDVTWNPTVGCTRVSEGCDHCYAFQFHDGRMYAAYVRAKRAGRDIKVPLQFHQPFSKMQLLPERLEIPLHWRKPRMVFVNSMSDLFHPDVPDEYIMQVYATMAVAKEHIFQVLTKRPDRMARLMSDETFIGGVDHFVAELGKKYGWVCTAETDDWPLPNVWLLESVEHQRAADDRLIHLLDTRAAVRGLSMEPLLGPVDLSTWLTFEGQYHEAEWNLAHYGASQPLGWVIIGGESGPKARPMDPEWALSIIEQCKAAGVPVFMKQMGAVWAKDHHAHHSHGGDPDEWPEAFRIREFPLTTAG